jgi:hypothetical protein
VLRTIEAIYGLTPLGQAANNAPLRRVFFTTATVSAVATSPQQALASIFSDQPVTTSAWERLGVAAL